MTKRLNCVCIDSSEHSERAFNWYVNNYHRQGDVVGLLHVHQNPTLPVMVPTGFTMTIADEYQQMINSSLQNSRHLLKKFEEKCKETNLECKLLPGDCQTSPGNDICHIAKENGAHAIIMGQRGLNTISRMLLGSTSDYVVHHAHIPVTVVPNEDHGKS